MMAASLLILPACFNNGPSDNESAVPWGSSFVEPAPDSAAIQAIASARELEMHAFVSDAARQAITDHIAVLLAGAGRKYWRRDDPPQLNFNPATESDAYNMAGVSLILQGSWSGGAWAFSQAVLSDPDDPFALNQLGWALLAAGRYEEAKELLLRAVEIMPELWAAWSSLGYLYEKTGDWRRAEYCYRRALESHSESLFIHLKLGALLLQQGDINGAGYYAGQALALSPDNPEAKALAERVEEQGGDVDPVQTPSGGVTSDAGTDVLHEINDCADTQTQWMMTALVPSTQEAYEEGMAHREKKITLQHEEQECGEDCHSQPSDTWDDCELHCQATYCGAMQGAIYMHYRNQLTFLHTEMGFAASYRSRYQSCVYTAIEDHQHDLSTREINYLLEYVDWQIALNEETYKYSDQNEYEAYQDELNGLSSACRTPEVIEEMENLPPEEQGWGIDQGLDACLDGFVCLNFGEGSIGFEVGVGVASGGVSLDYDGPPDLIFAVGPGLDIGAASVGVDFKLSIQHGFGVSPNASYGGPIRANVSRDFWLYSF